MKCSLCGFEFNQKDQEPVCSRCPIAKGCELVKCPNCGFEMAPEPEWIKKLRDRKRRKK